MARKLLGVFERTAILQVRRDARCAKRMAADQAADTRFKCPPLYHSMHIAPRHLVTRQYPRRSFRRAKQGALLVTLDARRFNVSVKVFFGVVVGQHLVLTTALTRAKLNTMSRAF